MLVFLIVVGIIVVLLILLFLYCSLVLASRVDRDGKMFRRKR